MERTYVCIDLKSFYEKTICLAITPSMKALGLSSRCRVFEIPESVDYVMAKPRMQRYMEASADIYSIYLRFVSPEDVHPYSIDECFIDATPYLSLYRTSAREFAVMLIEAVLAETGDQAEFERTIQTHRPITDIWNIGPGIARRLAKYAVYDLRGVCEMSEATLYREFGVNAEYLIDHAHGVEPCTIADIHAYEPSGHSLGNGQVLPCDYSFEEARDVLREMVDQLVLDLVEKRLVAESISLYVGYARDHEAGGARAVDEPGAYFDGGHGRRPASGRRGGSHTGGTRRQPDRTNLYSKLMPRFLDLFDETARKDAPIRRINVGVGGVLPEEFATMDLFSDVAAEAEEHRLQKAVLAVKGKFGKNALLRGTSLKEKATARERNEQIGGHHA